MKCDKCDKPAVIHEVTIRNGMKREIHLCEDHARDAGLDIQESGGIEEMLKQFVISHAGAQGAGASGAAGAAGKGAKKQKTCEHCSMTWSKFRKTATLGCPKCYESFAEELGRLIERAQGGASHHIGKTPRRSQHALDRKREMRRLTQELEDAVAAEEYERAARLRDALNSLEPFPEEQD